MTEPCPQRLERDHRNCERCTRDAIAYQIRAELVCCDVYQRHAGTPQAGKEHAICFWGEAAARIAEGRND